MKQLLQLLSIAIVLCHVQPLAAESVFSGKTLVEDKSTQQRSEAIKLILGDVLLKLTGQRSLEQVPHAEVLRAKAQVWVDRFHYESVELETGLQELWLHAQFNGAAIGGELTERSVALWPESHPVVLAWIAYDDGQVREILNNDEFPPLVKTLQEAAARRGIKLRFPIMDISERMSISVSDVWGQFEAPIQEASAQYAPDALLLGRVYRDDANTWVASWSLSLPGQSPAWSTDGVYLDQVLIGGANAMVDQLLPQYAAVRTESDVDAYALTILGITDYDLYQAISTDIRRLKAVEGVRVKAIEDDRIDLDVSVKGDRNLLERALNDVGVIAADKTAADGQELVYRVQ